MTEREPTYVGKACAYVTRNGGSELLVFEGPGHDGLQIPKGTLEADERPREALFREVREESGLATLSDVDHLATDVWVRREDPPKRYVRRFYRAEVHAARDAWTHVVRDGGDEHGSEFRLRFVDLESAEAADFALELDDYLHLLRERADIESSAETPADAPLEAATGATGTTGGEPSVLESVGAAD